MEREINLYEDLKLCIEKNFAFLKSYGFGDFEERPIAYEMHFYAQSDSASIDIWFEMTFETPVWVKVNGYYTFLLEPDNPLDKQYADQHAEIYRNVNTKKKIKHSNYEQYKTRGRLLNDAYLQEIAGQLQKYPEVLRGNIDRLSANHAKEKTKKEQQLAAERIEKQIYTCYFTIGSGIECEVEAPSLEAMKLILTQYNEPSIKIISVVNCYMDPVPFYWP